MSSNLRTLLFNLPFVQFLGLQSEMKLERELDLATMAGLRADRYPDLPDFLLWRCECAG
jgi:hypothetical protein